MTSFRYLGSDWLQSAANFLLSLDQALLLPLTEAAHQTSGVECRVSSECDVRAAGPFLRSGDVA